MEIIDADNELSSGGSSPKSTSELRSKASNVVDSDGRSSPSPSSLSGGDKLASELVPDDYYIEKEPPLILNIEPKTYGKRLASSSAQTDTKVHGANILTTSAKQTKKKGLLQRKRKNKTQLTIHCVDVNMKPSADQPADSSLETVDTDSILQEVLGQDPNKRTCTIQTDSDSVTVNYVLISPNEAAKIDHEAAAAVAKAGATGQHQDDGYVSGSGDIKKEGKGLFGLAKSGEKAEQTKDVDDESKADKKATKKKAKKEKKKDLKKVAIQAEEKPAEDEEATKPDDSSGAAEQQAASLASASEELGSVTPTSGKELKLKLKIEKQEKLKREKEEKLRKKELEEAASKAEKLKKKEAKKAEKLASKASKKAGSPHQSKSSSPQPDESIVSTELVPIKTVTSQSVKFADQEQNNQEAEHDQLNRLDSIQRIVEEEKERLNQNDGHDLIRVSISDKLERQEPDSLQLSESQVEDSSTHNEDKLISFSDSNDQSISLRTGQKLHGEQEAILKPILKQTSIQSEEAASAELLISEDRQLSSVASKLVSEATEEAVREADKLLSRGETSSPPSSPIELRSDASTLSKKELAKAAKEEKERLKKEAKLKAEEEKRLVKEAKEAKKQQELEAKDAAKQAKLELERQAKEAKAKEERLAREAKEEEKRLAKEAKEAKKKLKLEAKLNKAKKTDEAKLLESPEQQQQTTSDASASEAAATKTETEAELSANQEITGKEQPVAVAELKSDSAPGIEHSENLITSQGDSELSPESGLEEESKEKDKKKEKKSKKAKELKKREAQLIDASEPLSSGADSTATKSSFFSRLFSRSASSKAPKTSELKDANDAKSKSDAADESSAKPLILSEMYPSNPNDADGEMILEVNVPKDLLEPKLSLSNEKQEINLDDTLVSQTMATTIDESLNQTDIKEIEPQVQSPSKQTADLDDNQEEATLVNLSHVISDDDYNQNDDDATENVVSQANDDLSQLQNVQKPETPKIEETIKVELAEREPVEVDESVADIKGGEAKVLNDATVASASAKKVDLKEEKTKKELEAKLEKEAKKRAKEDEKLRKKQEKLDLEQQKKDKKLADLEAKKRAKEDKEKAKREAKEAKRLAELAKKQHKEDRRKNKKSTAATSAATSSASAPGEAQGQTSSTGDQAASQGQTGEEDPTSLGTPVKTETEIQRIVEEVVGDDGVITKTTKTIETKYVTLRQEEEVEVNERGFENVDIEQEMNRRSSLRSSSSSFSSGSSIDSEGRRRVKALRHDNKQAIVDERPAESIQVEVVEKKPFVHPELDEIRSIPSYFSVEKPAELANLDNLSEKKEMKKRIKLNNKLIKRAFKLAKSECKIAKTKAKQAEAEIAVCDHAAKVAKKNQREAARESKHATKLTAKLHKKMDKVDKKLAKNQKKIDKRQRKLDKKAEKRAAKLAKKRDKEAKKEAKLERKGSQKSKKSIKLEDIGKPVLKSSSRLSIGQTQVVLDESQLVTNEMMNKIGDSLADNNMTSTVIGDQHPADDDGEINVEMTLDDTQAQLVNGEEADEASRGDESQVIVHRTTTESVTINPDGQVSQEFREQTLFGDEARQAAEQVTGESDEEIDVVNELPQINGKAQFQAEPDQ